MPRQRGAGNRDRRAAAKATLGVTASNAGDSDESFILRFWYSDENGTRAFESSRDHPGTAPVHAVGGRDPVCAAGGFAVTVEALSVPGGALLNATQLTVTVPWLVVYLNTLLVVAGAIFAGSVLGLLVYVKSARSPWWEASRVKSFDVDILEGAPAGAASPASLHIGVRVENTKGGTATGTHAAAIEFDMLNKSHARLEFLLSYEALDSAGRSVHKSLPRVSLTAGQHESRVVDLAFARGGDYVLCVDVYSVKGRLAGKIQIRINVP
ncbi:hypothetical protein [Candidatus Nitrososphaera sp. FF02]|uniref:hypothetical protein n=1 Tax=Candidatus Nitrososphaera sp. FF02 TaxID=3398226 RepID=UPI0039EB94CC